MAARRPPKAAEGWIGRAAALAAWLSVASGTAACGGSEAADVRPLPLTVEFAGCETVLGGPRCVVPASRRLRLWVATAPEAEVAFRGARQSGRPVDALGGRRFEVEVEAGATEVSVVARRGGLGATWRLALARSPRPDWHREAWALARRGDNEAARRLAEGKAGSPRAAERGLAWSTLARLERRAGRSDREEQGLRQAIPALQEGGLASEALRDATVLATVLLGQWRLAEARSVVDNLSPPLGHAESAFLRSLYRGFLARRAGDARTALAALAAAVEQAERLDLASERIQAEEWLALELQRLGRIEEAAALLSRLPAGAAQSPLGPCQRAQVLNNQAWALILTREAGGRAPDPGPLLHQALALFDHDCQDFGDERVNVRINLALAHLHDGQLGLARHWLAEAEERTPEPLPELMLWAWDLEARLRLAESRPQEALALYDELALRAREILAPEAEWRLAYWRARTLEALGDAAAALASYARAENLLDEEILLVPMHEGRDTFIGQREQATRHHLELLLASGREEQALGLARRAHSRYLRSLRRFARLAQLTAEEREEWERTLAAHQAQREEVDRAAAVSWQLSGPELNRALAQRVGELRQRRRALDALLARLGESAAGAGEDPPAPETGEVLLAYYPLAEGWVGFAADGAGVIHRRLGAVEGAPSDLPRLAARLLDPFAAKVEAARRVRVLASGSLAAVDFHALPFGGEPLLASRPVVFALDLPQVRPVEPEGAGVALLVADPSGDLPAARREARIVRRALAARRPPWAIHQLLGEEATGPAVRERLGRSTLLHYAGHARFDGWDSHLLLAAGGRLTLDDILGLEQAPRWVLLSGCETGTTSRLAPVETLGLAHAFLTAGAETVVAAVRPLPDRVASALAEAIYRELARSRAPEEALRRAQLALLATDPAADWASFRAFVP